MNEEEPEIKHTGKPGHRGYRMGCRCLQGCAQEGEKIKARQRERRKSKLVEKRDTKSFTHGINGYRAYGCRCEVCSDAGALFNKESREAMREKRARKREEKAAEARKAMGQPQPPARSSGAVFPTETIDWSDWDHLRPGRNVRRRSA